MTAENQDFLTLADAISELNRDILKKILPAHFMPGARRIPPLLWGASLLNGGGGSILCAGRISL